MDGDVTGECREKMRKDARDARDAKEEGWKLAAAVRRAPRRENAMMRREQDGCRGVETLLEK